MVEDAFGKQTRALLVQLDAACRAADELAEATSELFHQHPDAAIVTSFPGLFREGQDAKLRLAGVKTFSKIVKLTYEMQR